MALRKHFKKEFSEALEDVEPTFGVRAHLSVQPKLRDIEALAWLVVDTSSSIHSKATSNSSLPANVNESSVLGLENTAGEPVEPLDRHKKGRRQFCNTFQYLTKSEKEINGYDDHDIMMAPPLHVDSNNSALFPSAGIDKGAKATENDGVKGPTWDRDKLRALAQLIAGQSSASPTLKMPPLPSDDVHTRENLTATLWEVSPDNGFPPFCDRDDGLEIDKNDLIKQRRLKIQHALATPANLVVNHSSSHSPALRSSSKYVHECEVMVENKKQEVRQQQLQSSTLNISLETINNENKEPPTAVHYHTFGWQWAGGCILVSPPPASMKL